jgi:hypothetical protein
MTGYITALNQLQHLNKVEKYASTESYVQFDRRLLQSNSSFSSFLSYLKMFKLQHSRRVGGISDSYIRDRGLKSRHKCRLSSLSFFRNFQQSFQAIYVTLPTLV